MAVQRSAFDVRDLALSGQGLTRIEWASQEMPVLRLIAERFARERPFQGVRIGACLHITTETANLALVLKQGGAEVMLCASNPLSTQDDVAAALVSAYGIPTYAIKGEDNESYYGHINAVLDYKPQLSVDDGADLVTTVHKERRELLGDLYGGTEETTTGVIRLRSMAREGKLKYPIISVNDAQTKHMFDNRYGTGQSTIDGITRATNILWAGKRVVVCGYGWCGRGIALRARGLGSNVIVVEVNSIRALEALMDGYAVMPMKEAAKVGDIFISAAGNVNVIDRQHFEAMKDGAILANSGHFNVEINCTALGEMSVSRKLGRPFVEQFTFPDGRRLFLLAEGRLVNLAAAEGHPASVMDMSFANQALCLEYLVKQPRGSIQARVHEVPEHIDQEVGRLKLISMGVALDALTPEQEAYLASWELGT